MERSRLPLPSLLSLFGALLMLSPELFLGIPKALSNVPLTDPGMMKALAFAVEQYNQERGDSINYFKMVRVMEAQTQEPGENEYHFMVDLVKAACKKTVGKKRNYQSIQKCKPVSGTREKPNCYFIVITHPPPMEMKLAMKDCI